MVQSQKLQYTVNEKHYLFLQHIATHCLHGSINPILIQIFGHACQQASHEKYKMPRLNKHVALVISLSQEIE